MTHDPGPGRSSDCWAHLRFAVIGPLLAAPPPPGELKAALTALAATPWRHPITGEPTRFAFSTIERWLYQAKRERTDPVGVLRRKVRKDLGRSRVLRDTLTHVLRAQYEAHPSWSAQLHADNLAARVEADPQLGPRPSYATVRRFLRAHGLVRRRRLGPRGAPGAARAEARLERREVRSYEAAYVHGLWHLDFHHGSRPVLRADGTRVTPVLLGVLDDRSRLCCHTQWYLAETAETLCHGLAQAVQKRGLPRAALMDNGAPMLAAETREGLLRVGVHHTTTLPDSPYQNAKQEVFWAQAEGRLLAMLEGVGELTLPLLNEATQAWVEMEYHHAIHAETGQTPLARFLAGPTVGRPCPSSTALRDPLRRDVRRTQRRSDGTLSLDGYRFEIPDRYRQLARVTVRYASWDLGHVTLIDEPTGAALSPLYPLDRAKNADGRRRVRQPVALDAAASAEPPPSGIAPLLRKLMAPYAATGLPPAYLPTEES
jgi:transposase InsO family protein